MQPIIFQDDLGKFSSCRQDAQAGNDKIEACMESKLMDLHKEKQKQKDNRIHPTGSRSMSPTLYGENMKKKDTEKYLGNYFHSGGVGLSVDTIVNARCGNYSM